MIHVSFLSDYACPFCYAARTAFLRAVASFDVDIEWLPYELTPPDQPPVDTLHDPVRKQHYEELLVPACRELSLNMHLPPRIVPRPYTRLAMEGQLFAAAHGKGDEYSDRIFRAYYTEEQDIGSMEILTKLAGEIGLPADRFSDALRTGEYTDELLRREEEAKQRLHPETVPLIEIEGKLRLDGDLYSVEQYREFLQQAQEVSEPVTLSGAGCGPDGCQF